MAAIAHYEQECVQKKVSGVACGYAGEVCGSLVKYMRP